ncbi:MAG: short chain dehydrogenase family protein [Alphaproteobacteria bacterium]|nr:short chain dehydrogenase family protein [Alphaproteobacteria bacterium]
MPDLEGKVAIVSGAAQGIGAAYARGLADAGAAVGLCDVQDPAPVVREIEASGGRAIGKVVDIVDREAIGAFFAEVNEAFGGLDILVNNAALFGNLSRKPIDQISSEEWDDVMRVNTRGPFECVRAALPYFRAKSYGKVINIASTTFNAGQPLLLHYVASKGAVVAMTRSMARELGSDGIRVNAVSPGFTLSEKVRANPAYTSELTSAIAAMRSIKRDQLPEDLVGTVIFLASPASDFISGQTLVVDGGAAMS